MAVDELWGDHGDSTEAFQELTVLILVWRARASQPEGSESRGALSELAEALLSSGALLHGARLCAGRKGRGLWAAGHSSLSPLGTTGTQSLFLKGA